LSIHKQRECGAKSGIAKKNVFPVFSPVRKCFIYVSWILRFLDEKQVFILRRALPVFFIS
ncbi:hypothetical protein LAN17_21110, partial [Mycobacterium tuberculosis]|nr:hypothetical protein [Mycobacterium tuberculosis]